MKTLSLSNIGQKVVKSYADGKKHQMVLGELHSVELIIQFC